MGELRGHVRPLQADRPPGTVRADRRVLGRERGKLPADRSTPSFAARWGSVSTSSAAPTWRGSSGRSSKIATSPAYRLIESFAETMAGLGTDVSAQPGVTFDIGSRPNKAPRAFCAPVRVPGEVYLVVAPVGGWDDYVTLFHEGGHTEHSAHVDAGLPFEFRCLGDNSVTETYAFVIQHLVEDPEWLSRRLGIDDASDLVAHAGPSGSCICVGTPPSSPTSSSCTGGPGRRLGRARRSVRAAARRCGPDRVADRDVPLRRRSRLLLRVLPACMGARDPSADLPARAVRPGVVRVARGGRGAARAVARRPAPRRRRAPRRADRRTARLRRGPDRPRAER